MIRRLSYLGIALISHLSLQSCSTELPVVDEADIAPLARVEAKVFTNHGHQRIDNYYWLRDDERVDPEMLAHLNAENDYTNRQLAHTAQLQDDLFNEITARLKDDDSTVPVRENNYLYHREYQPGGEYPVYIRTKVDDGLGTIPKPEVILNVNELSQGHEYYSVGNWAVSSDETIMAFAADSVSRRIYTIYFKDLKTGKYLDDKLINTSPSIAWANDNKHFFYIEKNPVTLLPNKVMRHRMGTPQSEDMLIYEELDEQYYTSIYKTRSKSFIVLDIESTDNTEIRLIDADKPKSAMRIILPRQDKLEYRVRHVAGTFYILTNWQAKNFRLMKVADNKLGSLAHWQEVIEHRPEVLLEDIEVFDTHLVLAERFDGLSRIKIIDRASWEETSIEFPDAAYTASIHANPDVSAGKVRYVYSSMTRPKSIFEYDFATGGSTLLKQDEVVGGYDASRYKSERIKIAARDGTLVPVSIVYRKNLFRKGKNPLLIYAYGSYGYTIDPYFSALRLSLLDRGFVYAIAHVRGSETMGRHWYEDGKLFKKRNTFWDFIDVTETLVNDGYGDENKIIAQGGSAGGLLMGVVANEAPEKYLAIIANVPFVDVVTTMLDESIPLTVGEFTEWGNPKEKAAYEYMLSYSPYDQIKAQAYPHIFVTTGLHDSQVQYFEPVKWVAKLRANKTDKNKILMHIDMETGHGGASGRYERYRTDALEFAFIFDLLKI